MQFPKRIEVRLKQIIGNEEEVIYSLNTTSEKYRNTISFGKTLYVILTNKKLIFLDKGTLNIDEKIILLNKIDSISQKRKILTSEIYIHSGSTTTFIINVEKKESEVFIHKINEQIENDKTFSIQINKTVERDITDKIEKLADLYKNGILTEYEFSTKKMELLENLKK